LNCVGSRQGLDLLGSLEKVCNWDFN